MTHRRISALALLALAAAAPSLAAQSDSVFAVSKDGVNLLRLNQDAGLVVRGTPEQGAIPASGEGIRMMWYPAKWAFRAGRVVTVSPSGEGNYWNDHLIGDGSAAFGLNNRAAGTSSFAAGEGASAAGARSLAFTGTASGTGAIALGNGAQATNDEAIALGPSSIAGGLYSIVLGPSIANGNFGVAIGLQNSASGQFSVAIGKNARTANRQGSVVIGDGCASFSSDSVYANANNQFVVRGCGGIRMFTSQNLSSGVEVLPGSGSWSSISDRNRKELFTAVDGEELLTRLRAVPVTTWNYRTQERDIRHMGPMAQDFRAAFGLGESELLISGVDIDGVNMAAAQALDRRTAAQQQRIEALETENAALRARLERIEALLAAPRSAAPAQR